MGLLLTVASVYVPRPVQKRKLEMLFRATADAFGTECPSVRGLSLDESLRRYALFSRGEAEAAIAKGLESEVESRLLGNARRIGEQFRKDFRVKPSDVMRMGTLIYKMLGIDLRGKPEGDIRISRCFFSTYYTSDVCRLISSLDEGLFVGLAGGGSLTFRQRITEGNDCCRAHLDTSGSTE